MLFFFSMILSFIVYAFMSMIGNAVLPGASLLTIPILIFYYFVAKNKQENRTYSLAENFKIISGSVFGVFLFFFSLFVSNHNNNPMIFYFTLTAVIIMFLTCLVRFAVKNN